MAEKPLERLEAEICEGAAFLAALALGKDRLRSAERPDEKRSAERSPVSGADALALMVDTMLASDGERESRLPERRAVARMAAHSHAV